MGRRRKKLESGFSSEAALCQTFIERATASGWTTYPEVDHWDIVLGLRADNGTETTIGVQAKLRRSWQLLAQASDQRPVTGPTYRAVLVPDAGTDSFKRLATALDLVTYSMRDLVWRDIMEPDQKFRWDDQPLVLPSVPGIGRAGTPAPIRLTTWREKAVVLCHLLRSRSWVSGHDFERLGVSKARWLQMGWIESDDSRERWVYVDGSRRLRYLTGCSSDDLPDARYSRDICARIFAAWVIKEPWL
jgi:hypothetical protein